MFKYETHLHTFPVSACAKADVRETVEFYKRAGYDGIFITNHFVGANINLSIREEPYEKQLEFYFSDYHTAKRIGDEIGIKVFPGVELSYKGADFLIYGLSEEWYYEHPEIMEMKKTDELTLMMEEGALVIQAHPFRERGYINHIRLFPRHVHGVEVMNICNLPGENAMGELYAKHYELSRFAGSDNHVAGNLKNLAGMCSEAPVNSVEEFIRMYLEGKLKIFTFENPEADETAKP